MIGPLGQMFVPFASVQGDVFSLDPTFRAAAALTTTVPPVRVTPAVGLEWSWPILATLGRLACVRADRADHRTAGRDARRQAAQQ